MDIVEENDNIAHENSSYDDDSSMDSDSSSVSSSDSDSMDSIDSSDSDDDDVPQEHIMLALLKKLNSPSVSTSSRLPQLMLLAQGNEDMLPQIMLLQQLQSKGELKISNPVTMGIIMQMMDLF